MSRHRFAWLAALIVLLLGSAGAPENTRVVMAQGPALEEVIKAVVRISGQRCVPMCREAAVSSGAIIHPSGVILTAYHAITDPEMSPAQFLDDYIIEMSEDFRRAAVPRYRARIIAVQPELDLALLRIYKTVDGEQAFAPFELTGLPTLSLGSTRDLRPQQSLTIMGYPAAAGSSIKVASSNLTGFAPQPVLGMDIPDAYLTVQSGLSEGASGGPVVAERDGAYRIVGVVSGGLGSRAEIGALRSIDLLRDLQWLEPQARARAQRVGLELGQNANGEQELRITLELDALDLAGRRARLVFYAFADDFRGVPVTVPSGPNRTRIGQLAFAADLEAQEFVDRIEAPQLRVLVGAPAMAAGPLKFRVLLWDAESEQVLWQGNEWYRPQSTGSAPLSTGKPTSIAAPTMTPYIERLLATAIAATTTARTRLDATSVSLPMLTPSPTVTPTDTQTPTATPTVTSTRIPTDTPTATAKPKPMFTVRQPTVNVRSGPGTAWPVIGQIRQDEQFQITGRNEVGDWWRFNNRGGEGWVIGQMVNTGVAFADVPIVSYAPPPPPTATPLPTSTPVPPTAVPPPPTVTLTATTTSTPVMTTRSSFGARAIVFSSDRGGNPLDLYMMDTDGSNVRRLTNVLAYNECPSVSHDGLKIAFQSNRTGQYQVYVMVVDGTDIRQLTNCPSGCNNPSWFPDDDRLLYLCGYKTCVITAEGSDQKVFLYDIEAISVSPDGSRVLGHSLVDTILDVFVEDVEGANRRRLVSGPGRDNGTGWSPDGHRIAYAAAEVYDGPQAVFVMDSDGRNQVRLTDFTHDFSATFSPDGTKLLFRSERDGNAEIYLMNADGTEQVRLTNYVGRDDYPAWIPLGSP